MFGLYPAGSEWTRQFTSAQDVRDLQRILTTLGGFTASVFHQPFGPGRGAVVAQRDGFIVLVESLDLDVFEILVVPDVVRQGLLWSHANRYANQWSARELATITGSHGWTAFLAKTQRDFATVSEVVSRAVDGSLKPAVSTDSAEPTAPLPPTEALDDAAVPAGALDQSIAQPHSADDEDASWEHLNCVPLWEPSWDR